MKRFDRTLAVAATTVFTTVALLNASVVAYAAPTGQTPSAPMVQTVPVTPQIGGMTTRTIDLNGVLARPDDGTYELHPLLATDRLKNRGGSCYGMITCCNSAWVQGCDVDFFEEVCTFYGGEVVLNPFSDGSINYECHEA